MLLGGLPLQVDLSPARWVRDAVEAGGEVAAVLPPVFAAYARVLHPGYRYVGDDDVEVSWAEVGAHNGTVAHPLVQWPALTGGYEYLTADSQPPVWDGAPADGHLPVDLAVRLAGVLRRHTGTPDDVLLALWDGYGWYDGALDGVPRLHLPARELVCVRGRIDDAARNLAPEPFEQSANLWWPADRAWCVATDIDLMSTYVGGTAACVADLLATAGLEAFPAAPADRIGWADDPVNPPPAG